MRFSRGWNAIIWIEILRSTGVQTGQSRLHNVKRKRTCACVCTWTASSNWIVPSRTHRASGWWSRSGSNRRPQACKARALPTELRPRVRQSASQMVGPGRVERPTSRLSGVRSNHLSYEPKNSSPFPGSFRFTSPRQSHCDRSSRAPSRMIGPQRRKGRETKTAVHSPFMSSEMSRRRREGRFSKTSSLERR